MTGICGVVGTVDSVDEVAVDLEWTGRETTTTFEDDDLSVACSFTAERDGNQPITADDGVFLWLWGSIFSVERDGEYHPADTRETSAVELCAELFDEHGLEFVSRLNGDFVGIIYDRSERTVSVFTDRLGLRDTYYVQPDSETLVFSTAVQSLSRHPAVTPAFDPDYITEYFACDFRTFGLKTPLQDTYLFPPGAITSIDTRTLATRTQYYWQPRYEPLDRPFSHFLDEFTTRFREAVAERMRPDREYGLLLSGGIDSRLVLAAMDEAARENLTAYHMAGWMSREARTAETVALTAGVDFEWLRRDRDYHPRALGRNPKLSNFVGTFEQAHAEGFMPEIRDDIDEMITASFADSMFKGFSFPKYQVPILGFGPITLPILKPMDSIDRYIDFWMSEPPRYLRSGVEAETVLRREIRSTQEGIDHHGVTYRTPRELFTCGPLTPRTNGSVLYLLQSLRQHLPAWSPYVDNRLIDLYLSMPPGFFVRRNIVRRAINRLDADLAGLGNANTTVPVSSPQPVHFVGGLLTAFANNYLPIGDPPAPHLVNGPWPARGALIRNQPFVREAIQENEHAIRQLPFLDWDAVREMLQEHIDGAMHQEALYGLVSLLEMPVTKRIVRQSG